MGGRRKKGIKAGFYFRMKVFFEFKEWGAAVGGGRRGWVPLSGLWKVKRKGGTCMKRWLVKQTNAFPSMDLRLVTQLSKNSDRRDAQ